MAELVELHCKVKQCTIAATCTPCCAVSVPCGQCCYEISTPDTAAGAWIPSDLATRTNLPKAGSSAHVWKGAAATGLLLAIMIITAKTLPSSVPLFSMCLCRLPCLMVQAVICKSNADCANNSTCVNSACNCTEDWTGDNCTVGEAA